MAGSEQIQKIVQQGFDMTFQEFISNNFAEIIGLIYIWLILTKENFLEKKDVRKFMDIFCCECVELVAFNLEKVTGYWSEPTVSRILLSATGYVLRAVLVYMFIRCIWPHESSRKAKVLLEIPIYFCILCGISPFFTDFVYGFTADNHFTRGPLGWIFMATVIGYVLVFVYYIFRQRRGIQKIDTAILLLIAFFIIASTVMSTLFDLEWMGRLSIVYGMVFCLFALDANKLKRTIYALQENEELKAALEELRTTKQEAERANRAKTDFLLRMSHDIRTPMNGIMGMLDIEDRYADDVERLAECRGKIRDSSKILLELVNEVLDMSKLESGEIVLEHIPFDLGVESKEVFYSIKKQADDRDIEIVQEDCGVTHNRLIGSPIHLKRLMLNIIGNAVKYNKEHGKIYITCKEVGDDGKIMQLEFICRDTGIGMSPEFLEHIFEPFTQENASPRTRWGGTGLGMSIAKNLTERMGGTITVESTQGEGTTFDVIIPFEIDASIPEESQVQDGAEQYSIRDMNILLAEDNELNMEIARVLLEEEGAKVTLAWNGQEAVDIFAESAPGEFDVILMDVMMPALNGHEAARQIRAMNRPDAGAIPIVAMTANAFTEEKLASLEAGMNDHIIKPFRIELVVKTVASLVAEYRG